MPNRQIKMPSASLSESGHPRNIPGRISPVSLALFLNRFVLEDACSMCPNPPKDLQVLIRKGDHHGISALITNVSLQQFRQMIGLQSSATGMNDRRIASSQRNSDNRRAYSSASHPQQPLSSSSSSSSSSIPTSNLRLVNGYKPAPDNKRWAQENMLQLPTYSSMPNHDRQHSPMSSRKYSSRCSADRLHRFHSSDDPMSMNYPGSHGPSTMNDPNLISPISTGQDMR